MIRIHFDYIERLTDPNCEPRHVATVCVDIRGPVTEYYDARGLDRPDRLAVLAIPEQAVVAFDMHQGNVEDMIDALMTIYRYGNVQARRENAD